LIGDQEKGVAGDPVAPAKHANDKAEEILWIATGEEDGEPGYDDRHQNADSKEEENDVVRNGEEPLDQGQPAIQLAGIWIGEVKVDGLLLVGRRVTVIERSTLRFQSNHQRGYF